MHRQRFERVRALFLAALRQPEGEARARFLDRHAGDCRNEVETLLRGHEADDTFLLEPPLAGMNAARGWLDDLLLPGDRVADYVIEAPLGRGGYGTVYRAEQLSMSRVVALKVTPATRLGPTGRRRALREVSLVAAIDAPNLVKVFAGGEDEERKLLYVAMQLVDGPDLASVMAARTPGDSASSRRMVERCLEVARGLAALHGAGLVHCDVKPANVVLARSEPHIPGSGAAVLVDLGLVHAAGADTRSAPAGTYAYLAPEVIAGRPASFATDVFGLGLMLFDAVTGRDPAARAGGTPPWLRSVDRGASADLEAIVARATFARPNSRYRDAGEVADDLGRWLAGTRVQARRVGNLARSFRFARENPLRAARRGAVTCAVALGAIAAALGIGHVTRTLARLQQARTALVTGQFAEHVALTASLPGWAGSWIDPDPQVGLLANEAREGLNATLATLAAHGQDAALLLAARYAQRDGLAAHTRLAAFLANAIAEDSPPAHTARRLCALLFHERPDAGPADVVASTSVRTALEQFMQASPCDPFTLAALGGCGDVATFTAMTALARAARIRPGPDREPARLVLRAMRRIAERASCCGFGPHLAALDHESLIADAASLIEEWRPAEHMHASSELAELAVQLALVRRQQGRAPGPAAALRARGNLPAILLAAQADPAAVALVAEFPAEPWANAHHATIEHLGWCVAWLGDVALGARVRSRIVGFAAARELDASDCLQAFDRGVESAHARLGGTAVDSSADSTLSLAAALDRRATVEHPLPVRVVPSQSVVAAWHMTVSPIEVSGPAIGASGQSIRIERDEYVVGATYVALSPSGASRVRLMFTLPEAANGLYLSIAMQKGARPALPDAGEACVALDIDGEMLMDRFPVRDAGQVTNQLAVPPLGSGEHTITVHLDALSTASLRLYDVRLAQRR